MKTIICFLSILTFCFSLFSRLSEADSIKVGCVDFQRILNESESGKKAKADLESLIRLKQSIIEEKVKAIQKLKSELEQQASVLSPPARKRKEDEHERLLREYERLVQDSQAEVRKKELELTDAILGEIREMVERIGKEEGYDLIIEKGFVIYSGEGVDITEMVLKRYNESKR